MRITRTWGWLAIVAMAGGIGVVSARAPETGETFTAKASVKTAAAAAVSVVTIRIDRYVSDDTRDRVMECVRQNDPAAVRAMLAGMGDVGSIEVAGRQTPIKFAYSRPAGGGRLITVMTGQPLAFIGGSAPDAKPREGFDLGLALLVLDAHDLGDGELVPAAKVKVDDSGAIVTSDYSGETVRLTSVARAK